MSKYKGDRLADGTPLNQAVYQAFRNGGLSHNQALAVTAEVGRENGFAAKYIFGGHIDPAGAKGGGAIQNTGFLSWNGNRGRDLQKYLAQAGVMRNGSMARTQEALNAQARFAINEMKGAYKGKLQHFWANPNADPDSFARELGKGYIVWAYGQNSIRGKNGGRVAFDWQAHDNRRRGYLTDLANAVGGGGNYKPSTTAPSRFLSSDQIAKVLPNYRPPTPQTKSANPLFFGDSIAHGYRTASGMTGTTKVGANPKQVLAQLQSVLAKDPNALRGQTVVLSSGLSNGNDLGAIAKQLQLLKNAGANINLLGVSNSFNVGGRQGKAMNAQLAQLAQSYGANFRGGFVAGRDNVHPQSYKNFELPTALPSTLARPTATTPTHKQAQQQALLVAMMGDYRLKDTGIGSGDHYDLRLARGANGVRGDINPYLNRFLVNGKGLNAYRQTGRYLEQRKGYRHEGVDYGINGSFGGDVNARKLFVNPQFGVKGLKSFFDKHGGGWVTQVHFDDDVRVNILHQNQKGVNEVMAGWQGRAKSTPTMTAPRPQPAPSRFLSSDQISKVLPNLAKATPMGAVAGMASQAGASVGRFLSSDQIAKVLPNLKLGG